MPTDRIPFVLGGYARLKAELDRLRDQEMPRIARQIARGRGLGRASADREHEAAVDAIDLLRAKVQYLEAVILRSTGADRCA